MIDTPNGGPPAPIIEHPRDAAIVAATAELSEALAGIVERHKMTYGEVLSIVVAVAGGWLHALVRAERAEQINPAPDK